MSNQVFDSRVERIAKLHKNGPSVDMLAGIGSLDEARKTAGMSRRQRRAKKLGGGAPLLSLILGGAAGFAAVHLLNDGLGFDGLVALAHTPDKIVPLAQADQMLGAAGAGLAAVVLMFGYGLLNGGKARRAHAFGFAGMAGAMAAAATQLVDIERLNQMTAPLMSALNAV